MNRRENRKTGKARGLLVGACLAGALAGCAGLEVHRVKTGQPGGTVEAGLRFPVPRPYVLVKAPTGKAEALDFEILYLPDPEEEILVKASGWFGPTRFKIGLDQGGFLRELSGRLRTIKIPDEDRPLSPAEIASLARGLEPGLYRVVWREPGDTAEVGGTPHLERVDPLPLPGPRITGILFQTCSNRGLPELVRQIDLVLDREEGAKPGELTRNVAILSNGTALEQELSWRLDSGRIVAPLNDGCSGEYRTYQVVLPDGRSETFPSAEQLARWTPRAEIHLVEDVNGNPSSLVIDYNPMEGSGLKPLEEVASLWVDGEERPVSNLVQGANQRYRHVLKLTGSAPRHLLLSVAPGNEAGLSGKPVSLSHKVMREEPPPPLDQRWVRLRESTVQQRGDQWSYEFVLEAKGLKIDETRTESHQSGKWRNVRCHQEQRFRCAGLLEGGEDVPFYVYCHQAEKPCLVIELDQL
jgi:hypothetical protein